MTVVLGPKARYSVRPLRQAPRARRFGNERREHSGGDALQRLRRQQLLRYEWPREYTMRDVRLA